MVTSFIPVLRFSPIFDPIPFNNCLHGLSICATESRNLSNDICDYLFERLIVTVDSMINMDNNYLSMVIYEE